MANLKASFDTTDSLIGSDYKKAIEICHLDFSKEEHHDKEDLFIMICNYASKLCNTITNRKLKSRSLSERHHGGSDYIFTNQFPINSITRLAMGKYGIIKVNNSSETTNATVSVTSSQVTCTLDGTDSNLAFSSYTTLTSLVTAINALGSNWSASIVNTDYNNWKSTELLPKFGMSCLDTTYAYLDIPSQYLTDFEVNEDTGEIYYSTGFTPGHKNVYIDYNGGYSTVPKDLEDACLEIILWLYEAYENKRFGITSRNIGDGSISIETSDMPKSAMRILNKYKKILL